jgi:magnesium and cobalt transporter
MIGYVDINRVLREEGESKRLEDFIEPGYYIPETMCVDDLLREFLSQRVKTAIVVDEYGGCAGWITREDILEEIVGELEDELDIPTSMIKETESGVYVIDGRTEIDAVNDHLGASFSDDEWDTMAGLVLNAAGRIPAEGDTFPIEGWSVKVLRMEHRRISQVEARRTPPSEPPPAI